MTGSLKLGRAGLVAVAALQTALLASPCAPALGQTAAAAVSGQTDFDLPSTSLYEALHAFSRQASVPLTILPGTPDGGRSVAVRGRLAPAEAMKRLMGGNAIPYRFVDGAVIVGKPAEADNVEILGPVTVTGSVPQVGMPADNGSSGLTVMGQDMIKAIGTPDKDPMRLLRVLPNVNFDNDQFKVGTSGGSGTLSEQNLAPARVSISGGKDYENKVLLDGMANGSVFDTTSNSEGDIDKIGTHNPLALFANSDILREVAVYDSNVPARYSGFTGGVIDMRTRDPHGKFRGSAGYTAQSDSWVHYRNDFDAPGSAARSPEFRKDAYDMSMDVPINKKLRTMVAASRQTAEQQRTMSATYSNREVPRTLSTRSSYLGAVSGDLNDDTMLVVKGLYAPYTQEYTRGNMTDDRMETVGDNYQVNAELRHAGDIKANLSVGFTHSGYERDAPDTAYSWRDTGSKAHLCTATGTTPCIEGGYGDIADRQDDFQVRGDVGKTMLGVDWSTGIDMRQTDARRTRDSNLVYYMNPVLIARTATCADPNDKACIAGEQVLNRRVTYYARDTQVSVANWGYWAEGAKEIPLDLGLLQGVDLRAGMRADYNDYFDNLNWAPRFSGTLRFPADVRLTLGANRYYSAETLSYAFYAQAPLAYNEDRVAPVGGVYSNRWRKSSTVVYGYEDRPLRTPYSDERTAALAMPLLWGDGRIKYLTRRTRDEIAQKLVNGTRTPTNDGWTNYQSVSVEWTKSVDNHAFLLNALWSDTMRNSDNYMDTSGEEAISKIYYRGNILPVGQLAQIADNFAQPIVINAAWTSKWLEDALTLNLTGKYRFGREEIGSTGRTTRVGGTTYTVYDIIQRNPIVRFDATASYKIDTWSDQQLELLAFVENVFNARSQTADADEPFERGRAYWFGMRYHF